MSFYNCRGQVTQGTGDAGDRCSLPDSRSQVLETLGSNHFLISLSNLELQCLESTATDIGLINNE